MPQLLTGEIANLNLQRFDDHGWSRAVFFG
jgi:hypothetical protein